MRFSVVVVLYSYIVEYAFVCVEDAFVLWSEGKLSKKFVFLKLLFLLVACVARRFKQSDCGDKAAKP